MLISSYNLTETDLQEIANQVKEIVLISLAKEKVLDKPLNQLLENYAVVVHKKGWLGRQMDKLLHPNNPEQMMISVVKVIHPDYDEKKEE